MISIKSKDLLNSFNDANIDKKKLEKVPRTNQKIPDKMNTSDASNSFLLLFHLQ